MTASPTTALPPTASPALPTRTPCPIHRRPARWPWRTPPSERGRCWPGRRAGSTPSTPSSAPTRSTRTQSRRTTSATASGCSGHWTRARKMLQKALADHQARGGVELPPDLVEPSDADVPDRSRAPESRARARDRHGRGWCRGRGRPSAGARAFRRTLPCCSPERARWARQRLRLPHAFEVQVDPGEHVFVLSTKGRPDVAATETLGPGSDSGRSSCGRRPPKRLASRAIP